MLCSLVYFAICVSKLWWEEVALRRSHLWMMSLHLDLLIDTWRDLSRRRIVLSWGYCVVGGLLVDRASVMRSGCLREKVVLIRRSLKMLTVHVLLSPWNLDLDIWFSLSIPITHSWWLSVLFAGIKEVLLSSIELVYWRWITYEINLLSWRATSGSSPSVSCAMPVSFNTFNEFPCLRIDLSERIYCITLPSASSPHLSIILCHTSDKSMVILVFCRIWNIVLIIQVIHSPLSSKMILLETSIHRGIHLDILLMSH